MFIFLDFKNITTSTSFTYWRSNESFRNVSSFTLWLQLRRGKRKINSWIHSKWQASSSPPLTMFAAALPESTLLCAKWAKNLRRAQLECSSVCALAAPRSKWCIVFWAKDFGSEYRQKNKPGNAAGWRHCHVRHRFRRCRVPIFHCFGVWGLFGVFFLHFSRRSNITDSYPACQRSDDVITRSDKRTNNANWISEASPCQLGTAAAAPSCNFALSDVKYDPVLWLIVEGIASQDTNTYKHFLPAARQIQLLLNLGEGGVCAPFPVAPLYEFRTKPIMRD